MTQHVAVDRSTPEDRSARARIGAAGKLLRDSKGDVPDGFAALLFARTRPGGPGALRRGRARGACARGVVVLRRAQGGRAENPLRVAGRVAGRSSQDDLGHRDRQRRHAVPGRLGDGRACRARPRRPPGRASDRCGRARQGRQAQSAPQEANSRGGEPRESFIHIHVERIDDDARRAEIVQSLEQVLAEVRLAVQDWRPMLSRVDDVITELKSNPPPVPVDDIAEAIQFLEWLAADNFTLLGVRDYALHRQEPRAGAGARTPALGLLRVGQTCRCSRAAARR